MFFNSNPRGFTPLFFIIGLFFNKTKRQNLLLILAIISIPVGIGVFIFTGLFLLF
jgi:hypothetical protein